MTPEEQIWVIQAASMEAGKSPEAARQFLKDAGITDLINDDMEKILEITSLEEDLWGVVTSVEEDINSHLYTDITYVDTTDNLIYVNGAYKKIIASYGRRLEGIPLIVLPDYDNRDKALMYVLSLPNVDKLAYWVQELIINAYKAALQDGKKYSKEDIKQLIPKIMESYFVSKVSSNRIETQSKWYIEHRLENDLQSLQEIPKRVLVETKIVKSVTGATITSRPNAPAISSIETKDIEVIATISTPEGEIIKALEVYYE